MKKNSDILIKVLSLGIGLAVGIVLIAKVFFELSYDSFYKDIDRVYTINTWYSQHGDEKDYGQVSGAVAVGPWRVFLPPAPCHVDKKTLFYVTPVANSATFLAKRSHMIAASTQIRHSGRSERQRSNEQKRR